MCISLSLLTVVAILTKAFFMFFIIILIAIIFAFRSFKWLLIGLDVLFAKPKTIITKGYRSTERELIYILGNSRIRPSKYFYSVIRFDDDQLKGKYISFDYPSFRHGEPLEIIYYPRSKYIVSIKYV